MPRLMRIGRRLREIGRRSLLSAFWYLSRPPLQWRPLSELYQAETLDVCIVGSGPAGAVLGLDLVKSGFKTVILESGSEFNCRIADTSTEELNAWRSSGSVEYPLGASRCQGLGGTSNLWTGLACPRLHPLDFQDNAYTPRAAPWPISYAELEPYYERAEQTLGVRGGILSAYCPPRRSILPPSPQSDNATLKVMLQEVGITVDNSPESAKGYDGDCVRVARDVLPYFSNKRDGLLICGGAVTRLLPDATGHINGAVVESLDGVKKLLRARIYVIACGALETARLLLLSRCRFFPEGIGNRSSVVGRHFMEHVKTTYFGYVPHRDFSGYGRCHQFYETFKRQGFGSVILAFGGQHVGGQYGLRISADIEMVPSETNSVTLADDLKDHFGNPGVNLSLNLTGQDIETIEQVRSLIYRIYADLGAQNIAQAVEDGSAITWLHHHMGSCRMGDNPTTSVTDRNLRVHQSPNLYVAGSAVFVTSGASNPTLTIAALSHRLADHLAARLQCLPSKDHATRPPASLTRSRDGQINNAVKGYA